MPKLSIEFDGEEEQKIATIKQTTGIKQTTELIRFLITAKAREIQGGSSPSASPARSSSNLRG